jgi:predicted nucleic acid-binding protein
MPDKFFVDTNSLLYAHDSSAGERHRRARALIEHLWDTRSGVLSTQVLQEFAVNLRRKVDPPVDSGEVRDIIADYLTWTVVTNGGEAILAALDLERRYQLSFWDSLIIAAAQSAGVNVLYSEDLGDGQRYGTVTVVNPLADVRSVND